MNRLVERKPGFLIGGGILAGILGSLCCIGPLILTLLGISGAAVLSRFDFLQLPMAVVVITAFGYAGYSLFKNRNSCEPSSICANPTKHRILIIAYTAGLIIAIAAITSPYWLLWILD